METSNTYGDNKAVMTDRWQITKPLGQCMLHLYDTTLWTDVVFRCEDQCKEDLDDRIRAHKIVLAARSPVFEAMFFGPYKDKNAERELPGIGKNQFKTFLRLVYSDDLDLYDQYDELVGIFELAHMYQVQAIEDGCCRKLGDQVSVDNACDLLDKALFYDNEHLIRVVSDFVDRNAEKVLVSDGFLNLPLQCLTYILKGNTFYAKEVDVFNRAIEWAKQRCESHDGQTIRQTLGEAFYFLRTPSMTNMDFLLCTKKKGYYSLDELEDTMDIIANYKTIQLETPCNSKTARYPFGFTLKCVSESKVPFNTYDPDLSENVTLIPNEDIYLTDIQLEKYTSASIYGKDQKVTLKSLHLSVKICFNADAEQTSYYTIISGNHSSDIHLTEPIHLYAGKSYNLEVTVTQEMVEELCLRAYRRSASETFAGPGSNKVCITTDSRKPIYPFSELKPKPKPKVIYSLTFKCNSKRN